MRRRPGHKMDKANAHWIAELLAHGLMRLSFISLPVKGLTYVPRVIVTDRLKSYGAAKREPLPSVEHRQHHYLNNRTENSHQPIRQRERRMQGFKRLV